MAARHLRLVVSSLLLVASAAVEGAGTFKAVNATVSFVRVESKNWYGHDKLRPSFERDDLVVEIRDARFLEWQAGKGSLDHAEDLIKPDTSGFACISHATTVTDWQNEETVQDIYYPEIKAEVEAIFRGRAEPRNTAKAFYHNGHTIRSSAAKSGDKQPVQFLHADFTSGLKSILEAVLADGSNVDLDDMPREEAMAYKSFLGSGKYDVEQQLKEAGITAENIRGYRVLAVNTWRSIGKDPVETMPLALVDARTLRESDAVGDSLGREGMFRRKNESDQAEMKFYTYPRMTHDELLVFLGYDSGDQGSLDTPKHLPPMHTAFKHPETTADSPVRESIELDFIVLVQEDAEDVEPKPTDTSGEHGELR